VVDQVVGHRQQGVEARRLVAQGGVSLDGETVTDPALDFVPRDGVVLRAGKRNYARLRIGKG